MNQREKIIEVARSQLGYKEGTNNDTKYGAWYGMNRQPWCAMFVSWCAEQAGALGAIIPKFAYVPNAVNYYKIQGRYHRKGEYAPQPGDLIFFGNSDHVGIVEKIVDKLVYSIEGNTSAAGNSSNGDGVYRRMRPLNHSWITGYANPNYEEEEEMKVENLEIVRKTQNATDLVNVKAVNIEGSNFIPLRELAALFGWEVGYDSETHIITVTKPPANSALTDCIRQAEVLLEKLKTL